MYIQHNIEARSDSCILIYLQSIHCPHSNIPILKRNNVSIKSHPLDTFYILQLINYNSWMETKRPFAHSRPTIYNETKQITPNHFLCNFSIFVHLIVDMTVCISTALSATQMPFM